MSSVDSRNKTDIDSTGWSANTYNRTASFVYSSAFTTPVLELLAPQPGERILDFGCGTGELTLQLEKIAKSSNGGFVAGVDASESMILKAKANGLENAFVSDIQCLTFPDDTPHLQEPYDAVFTNAALHWCKRDPSGVLRSVRKVLKPGSRFVGEMGGYLNCVGIPSAMYIVLKARGMEPQSLDPWYFPSPESYAAVSDVFQSLLPSINHSIPESANLNDQLLKSEGFQVVETSLHPRVTPLGDEGLLGWLNLFVRHTALKGVDDTVADEIQKEIVDICRPDLRDESGRWSLLYTRLRFVARLPLA